MIDAYTIGITLALNDGVSAGIDQIRRDLLLLDQAIAQTAAGLSTLQRLGQEIGSPQLPQPARPERAQPRQQGQRDAEAPDGARNQAPIAPREIPTQVPQLDQPGRTVELAAPERPRVEEASFSAYAAPLVERQPRDSSREIEDSAEVAKPPAQPGETPARVSPAIDQLPTAAPRDVPRAPMSMAGVSLTAKDPAIPDFAAFAPGMALPVKGDDRDWREQKPVAETAFPALSEPSIAPVPAFLHPVPALKEELNLVQLPHAVPIDWHAPIPQSEAGGSATPRVPSSLLPYSPPPAPTGPTSQVADRRAASTQLLDHADRSNFAAQTNPNGAGRSTSECKAEILVDGRVLGRVVSEQLAAQLIRPQHGYTGMDPRAVPTWPGVSVG